MRISRWMKRLVILDLFLLCLLFFLRAGNPKAVLTGSHQSMSGSTYAAEQYQNVEKKIALTFDDDVIIGLSQEISYKEAVSMI